jgi:hypothetical protein
MDANGLHKIPLSFKAKLENEKTKIPGEMSWFLSVGFIV